MIQKPNIKFLARSTIYFKETSQNSLLPNRKSVPKILIGGSAKKEQHVAVLENGP